MLARYAEVHAALHEPRLIPAGGALDESQHRSFRQAGLREAASVEYEELHHRAQKMLRDVSVPGDLAQGFFDPWSRAAAALVTGASSVERPLSLARVVFDSAAEPDDEALAVRARQATVDLARALPASPMAVQTFVALSQTLPCFLGSAWLALLTHPDELARLRAEPELLASAIEELLRYAGPSRAVFRCAAESVTVGGVDIARGSRVTLMIGEANRDPARFVEPDRLDLRRCAGGHLAFGAGSQGCAGAALIRMCAAAAFSAVLERFPVLVLDGDASWRGGCAIRGVASLPVA